MILHYYKLDIMLWRRVVSNFVGSRQALTPFSLDPFLSFSTFLYLSLPLSLLSLTETKENALSVIDADGVTELPQASKSQLAQKLISLIALRLNQY